MSKITYIDGIPIMVESCGQCPFIRRDEFADCCRYPKVYSGNLLGMRSLDKWTPMGTVIVDPTEIYPRCPLRDIYAKGGEE